jgi:hypothetical protein
MRNEADIINKLQRFIHSDKLCYVEIILACIGLVITLIVKEKINYTAIFLYIILILSALVQLYLNYRKRQRSRDDK